MEMKAKLKVGDKVKFSGRKYYQKCTVIEIEEGCNGRIKVHAEDGFFSCPDDTWLCKLDLELLEQN